MFKLRGWGGRWAYVRSSEEPSGNVWERQIQIEGTVCHPEKKKDAAHDDVWIVAR